MILFNVTHIFIKVIVAVFQQWNKTGRITPEPETSTWYLIGESGVNLFLQAFHDLWISCQIVRQKTECGGSRLITSKQQHCCLWYDLMISKTWTGEMHEHGKRTLVWIIWECALVSVQHFYMFVMSLCNYLYSAFHSWILWSVSQSYFEVNLLVSENGLDD